MLDIDHRLIKPMNTNVTVNDLFSRFEQEVVPHLSQRTQLDYTRHVKQLKAHFGPSRLRELTRNDITSFLNVPKGRIQRNRMIATLSSAISKAIGWGMIDSNVCVGVPRNKKIKSGERKLTLEEFDDVKRIAPLRMRLAMDLVRYTEQQQGAILSLKWTRVNETKRVINFRLLERKRFSREPKGDRKLEVQITPELQAVLDQCKRLRNGSDYVLPTRDGTQYTGEGFRAVWQRTMKKWDDMGNDRFTFHDIKRWAQASNKAAKATEPEDKVEGYPQFDEYVRKQATEMSRHYQVFFCLEQSIRKMITITMEEAHGATWWDTKVNENITREVDALVQKEVDSGMRQRSERMIDYSTFGQLREIIVQNWDVFEQKMTSKGAVSNVMATLNRLRGPIAHCCTMQDDEAERLALTVKDWFNVVKAKPRAV